MEKKIGLILLAAGSSIRYEGIKLLDTIAGKQMYLHILEQVKDLSLEPKVIVTQYDEIEQRALKEGFHVIRNERPQDGISRSIRLGVEAILSYEPKLEGMMFSVCDQPYITKETIEDVMDAFCMQEKQIVCATHGEKLGNPCIFGKKYFSSLCRLEGDTGGKAVVKENKNDIFLVQVENSKELVDIDTKLGQKIFFCPKKI